MADFDGFRKFSADEEIERKLAEHCNKYGINSLDAIKLFPVLARRQWLKRFLAHHEMFIKTLEVPGDIAELGVFRGQGLMTWANFLESYCISDRTKVVYGFDNWRGFVKMSEQDGEDEEDFNKKLGGFSPEKYYDELKDAIKIYDGDRFIPWKARIELIEGNIEETALKFVQDNPGVRFSLVHFDCDLYEPTKAALEAFWPRLSRGGVFLFDEYAMKAWPGETQAVDEFFADKDVRIKKLQWNNVPAGYIVKE
ncbi:MAG: class I SAM-dependent methyltransferase [Lachnospiraceae bacterium]|nr:class I SAM-dependent methyltransferase [Lachnospiraceae bacterium]